MHYFQAEKRGYHVIPNAEAVNKTMNRKNIRVFASEELGVKTSGYRFVKTKDELLRASQRDWISMCNKACNE